MLKLMFAVMMMPICFAAQAQEIATCRNPEGKVFFHFAGVLGKANAGWGEDKISNGVFTLVRTGKTLDLLYTDTRNKPISVTQEGGNLVLLRHGPDSITVLSHYPNGPTTEIYSFFREKDGRHRFTLLTSKTGDAALTPKSSVMTGICEGIRFDALD